MALTGPFLIAGNAFALDSATINVSATVLGTCTIQTSPPLMNFGAAIDPATFTDTTLNGAVVFRCTQNQPYSIDFAGQVAPANGTTVNRNLDDGFGVLLPYTVNTLSDPTGLGLGGATDITYSFNVQLLAADVGVAAAGTYTDNFNFDITP